MKRLSHILLLLILHENQGQLLETLIGLPALRSIRVNYFEHIGHTSEDPANLEMARRMGKLQDVVPDMMPFPCATQGFRSEIPPTSVDKVRPGDIDIVAAMGDSITAGVGLVATNVINFVMENRGISWSIGGQENWRIFFTLPNILKKFNPNLFGYALGDSLSVYESSQFNVAEPGAIAADMPYMANVLVNRIKQDKRVNMTHHWKLVTYMIGPNDICSEICYTNPPESIIENFRKMHMAVLRTLRNGLPRTIVNFVPLPHLKELMETTTMNKPYQCKALNLFECPCLFGSKYRRYRDRYYKIIDELHNLCKEIGSMEEFHTNDFTVVVQPFSINAMIPKMKNTNLTDYSYMSEDCFHFSQKLNAAAGNGLWNNMMEPEGVKTTTITPVFQRMLCPTQQHPYIFTRNNSPTFNYL